MVSLRVSFLWTQKQLSCSPPTKMGCFARSVPNLSYSLCLNVTTREGYEFQTYVQCGIRTRKSLLSKSSKISFYKEDI